MKPSDNLVLFWRHSRPFARVSSSFISCKLHIAHTVTFLHNAAHSPNFVLTGVLLSDKSYPENE